MTNFGNRPFVPNNTKPVLNPRTVPKTPIPFDANNYVTELCIDSVFAAVSRSENGPQILNSQTEDWSVLLNWDVLPYLRTVTIKGAQMSELGNSPISCTRDSCITHDSKVLDSLDRMAQTDVSGNFKVHLYGIDERCLNMIKDYPNLQNVIQTLWFHDTRDNSGYSTNHKLIDFGQCMANMANLKNLNITVGAPATADLTTFLPLLHSFSKLEKLRMYIEGQPVLPDAGEWNRERPIIPQSLRKLACTTVFLAILSQYGYYVDSTFQNVQELILYIEDKRPEMSLRLPFNNLSAFRLSLCDPEDTDFHSYRDLIHLVEKNKETLRKLALFKLSFADTPDLVQAVPDLEQLHIGYLQASVSGFGASLEYISDLCKLKHLTLGIENIKCLTSQKLGELLTQSPVSTQLYSEDILDDHVGSSPVQLTNTLKTVTIKLPRYQLITKMPKLTMDLPQLKLKNFELSAHASFHKSVKMYDLVPSVDNHQKPRYLWSHVDTCAAYVVFDVREISRSLYPDYYDGKHLKQGPYSNSSSVANSDDDLF